MPAPRVIGVEPAELPGAYRANMDDGSSMLLHGPSGEALARRYASTGENAMGPNAVADASDVTGTVGKGLLYTNPLTAGPALAYAAGKKAYDAITAPKERIGTTTVEAPQAQPEPGPTQNASVQQGSPQQPQQASQQTAPQSQAGPLGYTMKGIDPATGKEVQGAAIRNADGSIGIMLPGSKGSPGGMTALGKEAVAHTAEAEKEHARQTALGEIAAQRGADAAIDENAERQGYLIEQQKQLINQAKQQQDEVDKQTAAVEKLQAGYQAARDDFMHSKVDPDQYMKADKGRALFSMLGVALSQFGSAFTRQPNIAAEFVNSQIDRNIRAQEAAINVKGKAADNMLADLTRQTGDLKLAKVAMKQMLTERAAMQAEQVGLGAKNDQIKANAQAVSAKLAGDAALMDNGRKQAFVEHVMSNPLYYRKGVAGSAPRMALPTLGQVGELQGNTLKMRDQALQEAKLEVEKQKAGGAGSAVQGERTDKIASAVQGIQAAANVREELERRKVVGDAYDDPTQGVVDRVGHSQSNENINQNTTTLAKGVQGAFGKSDRDAADAEKMAAGGGSGRDRYQAASRIEERLVDSVRTELATLPPVQQQQLLSTMPANVRARILAEQATPK